ncbi:MAG: class I SAM-dependent methyltransferase [Anaerolineae bacterium]|nr:class I SAM-dependent methyltransferase [Anaerolineae bacterium]
MNTVHYASYYRWLVAKTYMGMPTEFADSVLDVGVNDGYFLSQIRAPYKLGVDISILTHKNLIQADAQRLPIADHSVSNIFAFDILEHIQNDTLLLSEIARVLSVGGTLWLSTTMHQFFIFPGGSVQRRFERAWGHVRRGYIPDKLAQCLPAGMSAQLQPWNEPFFRFFYIPLKMLFDYSPKLTYEFTRLFARMDARFRSGVKGHLFAKIVKHG